MKHYHKHWLTNLEWIYPRHRSSGGYAKHLGVSVPVTVDVVKHYFYIKTDYTMETMQRLCELLGELHRSEQRPACRGLSRPPGCSRVQGTQFSSAMRVLGWKILKSTEVNGISSYKPKFSFCYL